MRKVPKARSH